jgi:oligopeptide/dipeptide ABC transporter ATP-binding protein
VQDEIGAAVILIGHEYGFDGTVCGRVGVMYAGKLVEKGPMRRIFQHPQHPYTKNLIKSLPRWNANHTAQIRAKPPKLCSRPHPAVSSIRVAQRPLSVAHMMSLIFTRPYQDIMLLATFGRGGDSHMSALLQAKRVTKTFGGGVFESEE